MCSALHLHGNNDTHLHPGAQGERTGVPLSLSSSWVHQLHLQNPAGPSTPPHAPTPAVGPPPGMAAPSGWQQWPSWLEGLPGPTPINSPVSSGQEMHQHTERAVVPPCLGTFPQAPQHREQSPQPILRSARPHLPWPLSLSTTLLLLSYGPMAPASWGPQDSENLPTTALSDHCMARAFSSFTSQL